MLRWTAAKGVARICARIPLKVKINLAEIYYFDHKITKNGLNIFFQKASEVVSAVLKQRFSDEEDIKLEEGSSCWMSGCLTLAELCRRGCLLPDQLPKVSNK